MIEVYDSIINSLHRVIDQKFSGKIKKLSQEFFCTNCAIVTKRRKNATTADLIKSTRQSIGMYININSRVQKLLVAID